MKIIEKAVEIAALAHDGQYRKESTLPYLSHPITVGFYLMESGASEETIAAGILHDVIEDTSITYEMLKEEFGQVVANLVAACSEPDKQLEWEKRKEHTIEKVKQAPFSVKQITCADKLHNLTTIKKDYDQVGEQIWQRFNRGREKQKWYYESIYNSLLEGLSPHEAHFPLFSRLKTTIEDMF
ncbi:HD domain-containing protein [Guptibacillus hwajinpoensis]|uniref:HD domain-containing protein n=1 Tax=Guptibacillus hwajinpoensis TaxID=208199 RepID=UPI0024B35F76|nr:HD domain-containing protein [Pseudalkalibacillus hwajinpoensis]